MKRALALFAVLLILSGCSKDETTPAPSASPVPAAAPAPVPALPAPPEQPATSATVPASTSSSEPASASVAGPASAPESTPQPASTTSPVETYKIAKGDTLYRIARKHNVDYHDLAKWNGIDDPNHIAVGQQLKLRAP